MARHDYRCPDCGYTATDVTLPMLATPNFGLWPLCPTCRVGLTRLACAPNFAIKGYNAKTGYSTK